jgi:2-C-methyl-D-erythritol 4-phosphate cytidylyltransferase
LRIGLVLAAAGLGTRLKSAEPKAFVRLGDQSLIDRALAPFLLRDDLAAAAVAVPDPAVAADLLRHLDPRVRFVQGGADRQASVAAGLAVLGDVDLILVHDAARPLVEEATIAAVIEAAVKSGAAVPAVPAHDTIKEIGAEGRVKGTLQRAALVLVQTPQGFRADLLRRAHADAEAAGVRATDDASLVERLGEPVVVVPGRRSNLKITTREDVLIAEAILAARAQPPQ